MGTISSLPITTKKESEFGAVTTMDPTDYHRVIVGGLNKKILHSALKTLLNAQSANANLDIYAGITPGAIGQNILAQAVPTGTSYTNINHAGVWSYLTALQVVADLVTNGHGVDINTVQYLANKIIGGMQFLAGSSTDFVGIVTDIPAPTDTYLVRFIKVGYTGGLLNLRFTGSTDVTFPTRGVLATIGKIGATSDATQASASTLDLDSADGGQVDVTGTTSVTAITLAENSTKLVRFTGVLTLTYGASLLLPGGLDIVTAAGDFAVFKGGSGGIVTCIQYFKGTSQVADINGGSIIGITTFGMCAPGASFDLRLSTAETLTANRKLTIETGDAARTFKLRGNLNYYSGTGSPESVITALVGSIYTRTDGGAGTVLYIKESGSGNTGWVAK